MEKDPQEISSDSSYEVKPKRKRGRPPKVKPVEQDIKPVVECKYEFSEKAEKMSKEQLFCLRDSSKEVKEYTMEGLVKLAKVVQVYDGDSIKVIIVMHGDLLKVAIRLQGYDTAEIRSKVPEVKAFAEYTRELLRDMLLGKIVKIRLGKSEKYGRTLGRIMMRLDNSEVCLNDWIIESKLALPYEGGRKREFTAQLTDSGELDKNLKPLEVVDYVG